MKRLVPPLECLVLALVSSLTPASRLPAQSALRFTLPFGPYAVGFRSVDQYDYSRTFVGANDQDGQQHTGERARPIQTSIWYPAAVDARAARMRYAEYLELQTAPGSLPAHDSTGRRAAMRRLSHAFAPADTLRLQRELDAATHAVRDASPATGTFPVIVYGPSLGAPSFENAQLMEYLASYGYIVLASPSLGAQGKQTADAPGLESEARDMEFLIGYARKVPGADARRLAVMGFSWGGIADVLVACRNPGVRALVSLDGSIAYFYHRLFTSMPFGDAARLTIPALFLKQRPPNAQMRANLGPDTTFDFFKDIHDPDAYLVNLVTLAHQNFGEWFDRLQQKTGPAFVADTAVQSAGYERIALYTRQFLDGYLRQSAAGREFLARSPAENGFPANEVVVERKAALSDAPAQARPQARSAVGHVRVGGRRRSFIVDLPARYDGKTPVPLVVVFHGGGGNGESARTQTRMSELAERDGFIAVYPNGSGALPNRFLTWNTGSCCGYAKKHGIDDVAFVRALLDSLEAEYKIDRRRVYATGLSNGGMMSHMMACALSDRFAAVAPVSGELSMDCTPAAPVSVLMIHGTADQNLPYNGGIGSKALDPHEVRSVQYALDTWVRLDRCPPAPAADSTPALVHRAFAHCAGDTSVELYTIIGGGHAWPKGNRLSRLLDAPSDALDASRAIWDFFTKHPRTR